MTKRAICLLAAAILLSAPVTAQASEAKEEYGNTLREEYEGKVYEDPRFVVEEEVEEDGIYQLSDVSKYDSNLRQFIFRSGSDVLYSDVPSGTMTTGYVKIWKDDAAELFLYRNGESVEFEGTMEVSAVGNYVVNAGKGSSTVQLMTFSIISNPTNRMNGFQAPTGCMITGVTLNDTAISYDRNYVQMTLEGNYNINYECPASGTSYQLSVTTDFTPPTLALKEVNESGFASGPVDISDVEDDTELKILVSGHEVPNPYNGLLSDTGTYQITATDAAGNQTNYTFVIKPYLNVSAVLMILLLLILSVALVVFIVRTRKHLRVR